MSSTKSLLKRSTGALTRRVGTMEVIQLFDVGAIRKNTQQNRQ